MTIYWIWLFYILWAHIEPDLGFLLLSFQYKLFTDLARLTCILLLLMFLVPTKMIEKNSHKKWWCWPKTAFKGKFIAGFLVYHLYFYVKPLYDLAFLKLLILLYNPLVIDTFVDSNLNFIYKKLFFIFSRVYLYHVNIDWNRI